MPNQNHRVEKTLETLKKDFIVVGKTRVRSWHAWLIIGLCAGILAGILFVANRSGEFSAGEAASLPESVVMSEIVIMPDGTEQKITPRVIAGSLQTVSFKTRANPLESLPARERDLVKSKLKRFVVIPKNKTISNAPIFEKRLKARRLNDIKSIERLGVFSFEAKDTAEIEALRADPEVAEVRLDNLMFLQSSTLGIAGTTDGIKLAQIDETPITPAPDFSPVKVGIVDTGVDKSLRTDGASFSLGPEMIRFYNFFQPWQSSHSISFNFSSSGGWLNVNAKWFMPMGLPSPSDLDLVLKNESGEIIAESTTVGNIPQSESIELNIPPSASSWPLRSYTAELRVKPGAARLATEHSYFFNSDLYWPAFITWFEAGNFPAVLDIVLGDEINAAPTGALTSFNNKWKKGEFILHGKKYQVVMSDMQEETNCGNYNEPGHSYKAYAFVGYDGISIDTNNDGDFSDIHSAASCTDGDYAFDWITLDGEIYIPSINYSFYETTSDKFRGDPKTYFEKYQHSISLNDKVIELSHRVVNKYPQVVYGPNSTQEDFLGHGTHVAGIVKSIAPNANIYNAKVAGRGPLIAWCFSSLSGNTACETLIGMYESDVIYGINNAINNGAKVINLSLGGNYTSPTVCEDFLMDQYIKDAIVNRGITFVIAAGNSGPAEKTISMPGCIKEAITVGAVGTSDTHSVTSYSSRGPTNEGLMKPDLVAIGGDYDESIWQNIFPNHIYYFYPGGVVSNESSNLWSFFGVADRAGEGFIKMSGTSMATPQVAGAVAMLLGKDSSLTPAKIKEILMFTADDLGLPKEVQGAGLLNLKNALSDCTRANPTIDIVPSTIQSVPRGETVSYTVTVTNKDHVKCPATSFYLDVKSPAGWPASFDSSTLDIAPGQTVSTIFKLTVASDAVPTSYQVNIVAVSGFDKAYSNLISIDVNAVALIIYRASADFSGNQGYKNWYYQDDNGNSLTYDPANSRWQGTQSNHALWKDGGHPGTSRAARRRWIAPIDGTIRITGNVKDTDSRGGDGVRVLIRKNGNTFWDRIIQNSDITGYNFDLTKTINAGDKIDFTINPRSNNNNDSTYFDPMITYQ